MEKVGCAISASGVIKSGLLSVKPVARDTVFHASQPGKDLLGCNMIFHLH